MGNADRVRPREEIPPGEAAAIEQIKQIMQARVQRAYESGQRPARRDAHPKSHGCVRAEVRVDTVMPALRHGLFAQPKTWPAWIRFSSGANPMRADGRPNFRGVAIKVMGVPGDKLMPDERETQDLVLLNHPVMFIRNAVDYAEFFRCVGFGGELQALPFFFRPWPPRVRLHELLQIALPLLRPVSQVLDVRYWSQTPFLCGEEAAVRFSLVPATPQSSGQKRRGPDFLRRNLAAALREGDAWFELFAETWRPGMDLEDPTLPWPTATVSRLAVIRIPAQEIETPERRAFDENLSFSPWHALPEHRPLGGVNRARRAVYDAVSELRHRLNGAPREEPRPGGGPP